MREKWHLSHMGYFVLEAVWKFLVHLKREERFLWVDVIDSFENNNT